MQLVNTGPSMGVSEVHDRTGPPKVGAPKSANHTSSERVDGAMDDRLKLYVERSVWGKMVDPCRTFLSGPGLCGL